MNLKDRFIKYIAIDSMSDEESGTHPSSKKQFDFAEILISDLKELGVIDIEYDPKCYVYAHVNKLQLVDDVKDIKHQVSIDEYMYNKNKGKRLVKR